MPFKFNPLTGLLDMVIDPVELINHVDLLDMPDIGGINADHDARYYTEAESDAILLAHIAIAAAHHARYTDAEADARIAIHTLIAAAHHAKTVSDEVYGLIRVGLFAGLPAPGILGRFYWATDNLILYYDTGAAWVEAARGETVTRLAQLAERAHGSLTGVTAINHHTAAILEALLTTQNDVIVRGAAIPERLNIAVNSMLARAAANIVSLTIADNTFVGRGGTNLGGIAVATNEIVSRAAGNLGTLAIPVDRLVGRRVGQNLEAISPANIWAFLSGHPAAPVDMNGQKLTNITGIWDDDGDTGIQVEEAADEDKIRMDVAGTEAFLLSNVGILTYVKQSFSAGYASSDQTIAHMTYTKIEFDTETSDTQNEFNLATETYTVTEAGAYMIVVKALIQLLDDGKSFATYIYKNGVAVRAYGMYSPAANSYIGAVTIGMLSLAANDAITFYCWHNNGGNLDLRGLTAYDITFDILKIA